MSLVVNTPLKARYVPLAADIAYAQAFVLGHADAAIREIESAIAQYPLDSMPPGIRPYGNLIRVYVMASRLDRARAVYADYEKSVPREIRDADGNALSARGLLSLNSGDARSALTDFRRWGAADRCVLCSAFAEAQAFERMSQKDSAIAAYERYANGHALTAEGRAFNLAAALRRLGELYESQGAKDKAIEYYTRFVDLWKDADPELQPLVKDVRRHVADLAGEPTHKQDS
jgi:tetratricopeptide (TPR) repeat protein